MIVTVEVLCGVVVAGLLAFASYGTLMGVVGGYFGERFERCPDCGRLGMTQDGERHAHGCPHAVSQLSHAVEGVLHGAHVRHD